MSTNATSVSTLDLVRMLENYWGNRSGSPMSEEEDSANDVAEDHYSTFIQSYLPKLNGPVAWLSKVEAAIRESVPEELDDDENEGQWLNADSAFNAIRFLQNSADLLPGEPAIYGTPLGDFVAEFESDAATLTSVVSAHQTLLVGVCISNPNQPVEHVITRGSNRLRDEVREFTKKLAAVHGEAMGPVR